MRTLVPARSSRVWPGACLAPAVMTTTSAPSVAEMSPPPVTVAAAAANWVPWARSSTSASALVALTSKRATLLAEPRIRAA